MAPASRTLTPEEVVFRTNTDSKSIIFVFPDRVLHAREGLYGGYLLRLNEAGAESPEKLEEVLRRARAFFVEPRTEDRGFLSEYRGRHREVIEQWLQRLPDEVRREFEHAKVQEIVYRYVEVAPKIVRINESRGYAVIDFEPLPGGLKLTALAVRLEVHWAGSRKYPETETAPRLYKEWVLKYPENEVLQRYVYAKAGTGYRGRGSSMYLKIVVEAPRELVPTDGEAREAKTGAVVVRGFLVVSHLPSKALLDAHLPEIFRDTRIGTKQIKLAMGYFYNKLGTLSRKFYNDILKEYAVWAGFGYVVPRERVPAFLRAVDALRREYAIYEKQLKEFLLEGRVPPEVMANKRAKVYREYLEIVREYLRKHGKEEEVRRRIEALSVVDRVRINLVPFSIDMSILEEYMDEKVRRRVEQELYEVRREMVEAVRKQLEERAREIIERLESYARQRITKQVLEGLRRDVEEVRKLAQEFGVESRALETLEELLSMPEEELAKKVAVEASSGRLKALLEEVGG